MSLPHVECIYLTEDVVREFRSSSSNPTSKNPRPPSAVAAPPAPMLRFLYELCWTVVRGDLPLQKCKAVLDAAEFSDKPTQADIGSTFADIVGQMALDLTLPGEFRTRLLKMAKWLVESSVVPVRLFHERCGEEFLQEAELIKIKAQDLKNKEVRVNTRLLYQQTKFNLLREESEGYAKLVTLLCQLCDASTHNSKAATIGVIKSLIGHFDLDPNRVFDIVLECFELQSDVSLFLDLIPIFPKSHASQILGFKFQFYHRTEVNMPVSFGLYKLTALLVKEDFIDLDSVYAHLLPKDDESFEQYNSIAAKRIDEANRIGRINLAATGKDLMEDEKQGDVTVDLFAALDMESEAVAENAAELSNNQSLGLLLGFLSVDDWRHAYILFERLSPLNPVAHLRICDGLLRIIETTISPAYNTLRQAHVHSTAATSESDMDTMDASDSLEPGRNSFIDLPKELFQMLACAGPYLYRNTLLLQKVCRVLRGYYQSALELLGKDAKALPPSFLNGENKVPRLHLKEARLRVEEALGTCLLPSLQLVPANPAIGQEIWEVMNLLPYEVRYRLYGEWEKDDEQVPMILAARQTAKLDTRRILKRLAKENLKQLGRMVAKLAHANPMTVLRTIVHQIEAYKDMITPVVDAFKYLTQLEYDILEYVVIERLAQGGRDKLKDDGLNLSDWLQSLASFWGHLCKKYPSMELRGLFQYLVNQLKRGQGIELVLLQELIQQMANVQYTENLTEEQLDAMAGSETLRYQATSFGITRNNKALVKSTNRLRDSLLPKDEQKLAIPLLLLIAQHRSLVVINDEAPYIKMVSEQFDRCHGTLLQYVDFLCSAVTPTTAYAQLIPSLHDLVHVYHLDPEVAFLIYRPVMRLFKCNGISEVFWPLDDSESANSDSSEDMSGKLVLNMGPSREVITWSELHGTIKSMLPAKAWNSLSPDLYATFWGLSLYDLYVPRSRYESEIAKQHASLKALEELSDNSSSAIMKRKKEKEKIQESLDRLTGELQKHEDHVASVKRRLSREKDNWLSSCPDTLKINMEFLQRCIFPRCTFSMPDAVYCAMFVLTLHSLGTPFFNTVNHIDVLICKTLQPMICCCTEYEVGRLGRFLCETLKTAYYWKSDESIYERECGNMPGFAVYYRYPNSQRVTYGQFIKVHWKWSQRITRLLIQCLESTEYMEIRNALIMLTKISGVFPVTRKTGINLEKRVAKIKSDEREDLKVLATGVAAALAARKPFWVTDEEFGMGYIDIRAPSTSSKSMASSVSVSQNGPSSVVSQSEPAVSRSGTGPSQPADSGNPAKEQTMRTKPSENKSDKADGSSLIKVDGGHSKVKGGSVMSASESQTSVSSVASQSGALHNDEAAAKATSNENSEAEFKSLKRAAAAGSVTKPIKPDPTNVKDDGKLGKAVVRGMSSNDKTVSSQSSEARQTGANAPSGAGANGNSVSAKVFAASVRTSADIHTTETRTDASAAKSLHSRTSAGKDDHSPRHDSLMASSKAGDKLQKRGSPDDIDRVSKRRKGEIDVKDADGDVRLSDRERSVDARLLDQERKGNDEQTTHRNSEKVADRSKDRVSDRHDRDLRDRLDRSRGDETLIEKSRDRSLERYGGDRLIDKSQERPSDRGFDRISEKIKEERGKDERRSHIDERFHGQGLPPPPPLPPHMFPSSVSSGRRDDDADRRFSVSRHGQHLSPRHDERERRRSEENMASVEDAKRRREDDLRERKQEEREAATLKVDERERGEREREKQAPLKEEMDASVASKRRKLKRDHPPSTEPGEFSPVSAPPPLSISLNQPYDGRDRGDRKVAMGQRPGYLEEPGPRMHAKDITSKMARRDADLLYERGLEEEKKQRAEQKRRHRK
ncbi:hypothetical protein MLD38_005413 [Melastoma candidum]|uniref:Uncharacterized protein n=1 Tax=Melastoma candidum TaxID=119954 RepID=A0ACB9RJP2_9MYRT|nr:hypothetical protein MLD38_005413 [Melastoma candidum]